MTPSSSTQALDPARELVSAERQRQIEVEGWTAEHDDAHARGEMLWAATIYRASARREPLNLRPDGAPTGWPWEASWWKPKDPLSDLVRAGALCLAEADRARRANQPIRASRESYDAGQPAILKLSLILGDINAILADRASRAALCNLGEDYDPHTGRDAAHAIYNKARSLIGGSNAPSS